MEMKDGFQKYGEMMVRQKMLRLFQTILGVFQ